MEKYGDNWTEEKLKMLRMYLNTYTTALKNQRFRLIYIDAFAGPGYVKLKSGKVIDGSPQIAVDVKDKPFDELLFNDLDEKNCSELTKSFGNDERVTIFNEDANSFLKSLNKDWKEYRGVLFVDPFAAQLDFATLEKVASYEALDTWILFPIMAISRTMPKLRRPDDVSPAWAEKLTRVFGGDSWRDFYKPNPQPNLFGYDDVIMDEGVKGILSLYKRQLHSLFGNRLLEESKTFKNEKNSAMFEFVFCVGNPRGISVAKKIARHNITKPRKRPKKSSEQQQTLGL